MVIEGTRSIPKAGRRDTHARELPSSIVAVNTPGKRCLASSVLKICDIYIHGIYTKCTFLLLKYRPFHMAPLPIRTSVRCGVSMPWSFRYLRYHRSQRKTKTTLRETFFYFEARLELFDRVYLYLRVAHLLLPLFHSDLI